MAGTMANWLSRATSLFQQNAPQPEPFEVVCDCGGRVIGERTKAYQKPNCNSCGRPVFVLPLNVYPTNRPPAKSGKSPADTSAKPPPPIPQEQSPAGRSSSPGKGGSGKEVAAKTKEGRSANEAKVIDDALFVAPVRKPFFTPLRKIISAIVVLSSLTVGGIWYRYRLETAKITVSRAAEAGFAALRERDFTTAARELGKAKSAVDIIGRTDDAAHEIRRSSREATAITKLASTSIADILQTVVATGNPDRKDSLRLPSADRGAWVIFDTGILPSEKIKNRFVVESPIQFDDGTVTIEIETTIFKKLPRIDDSTETIRVIFAAQLDKIAYSRDDDSKIVLTLNGATAFLWSNFNTYTAIGYLPFDEDSEKQTRAVLEHQIEMQL